jgi:glycerol kinase
MLADVLRTRVSRLTQCEASAFGACIAAGLAVQAWTMQGVLSLDMHETVFEVSVILTAVHAYATCTAKYGRGKCATHHAAVATRHRTGHELGGRRQRVNEQIFRCS